MKILLIPLLLVGILIMPLPFAYGYFIDISLDEFYQREDWLKIQGETKGIEYGDAVVFKITSPHGNSSFYKVIVERFGGISLQDKLSGPQWSEDGTYIVQVKYEDEIFAEKKFKLTPEADVKFIQIPDWIKVIVEFWVNEQIADSEFVQVIQYLIQNYIIVIPPSTQPEETESTNIPSWIKISSGFWVDGKTTDEEFARGLEYLVNHGIIRI